jgi:hypothetical protein
VKWLGCGWLAHFPDALAVERKKSEGRDLKRPPSTEEARNPRNSADHPSAHAVSR